MELRTAEETEALLGRHRPYLEALGWEAETTIRPRRPLPKEPLVNPPGTRHRITVKFNDRLLARATAVDGLAVSGEEIAGGLLEVVETHGLRFEREHSLPDEELARLEARAIMGSGEMPADLSGMLVAIPGDPHPESVRAAADALLGLDAVEYVVLTSDDEPPPPPTPFDIDPPSELLSHHQTYRTDSGIAMDWAWQERGARGGGIRVTNLEYAYNPDHEDMVTLVNPQPGVNSYYTGFGDEHGTAVLGVLTSAPNAYGMTGMVPDASVWFYPEFSTVNGQHQSRSAAIAAAISASGEGDVILLEMQTGGAQGGYGPAEYNLAVWNVVKTGTDAGVHVVAAAGNGNENLDAPAYEAYRNRGDSGSIIVGAGNSSRAKLSFSTHGSRINLQGWGTGVATLGYGGLRHYGGDHNQKYTSSFNGTSSASPIVTSAVAALQSFAIDFIGRPLTPVEMRQVLIETGKPQSGNLSMPIGPLPDMRAAIGHIEAVHSVPALSGLKLSEGSLAPLFSPEIHHYATTLPNHFASITVTAEALHETSTIEIRVNGSSFGLVSSGSPGPALPMEFGANTIEVVVQAFNGTIRTYFVSVTRERIPQTILFPEIGTREAHLPFTLSTAGGGSGNPVVYTLNSGPATLAGNVLTFTGAGTVSVTANQAGNATYAAAAPVTRTFSVVLGSQTITFTLPATAGAPDTVGLSVGGGSAQIAPVFQVVSGPGSITGTTLSFTGEGAVVVSARKPGSAVLAPSNVVERSIVVTRPTQTITFAAIGNRNVLSPVSLSATGGPSGNPVVFAVTEGVGTAVSPEVAATINSTRHLTFIGAGFVTVTATQAGNATYQDASPSNRRFEVTKANAAVTLSALSQTFDGGPRGIEVVTNPPGAAYVVTYNGSPEVPQDAGTYAVAVTLNDPIYQGSRIGTLTVAPRDASITLSGLVQRFDGRPKRPFAATNPPGLEVDFTFNGSPEAPSAGGRYEVEATFASGNYRGSARGSFLINRPPVLKISGGRALRARSARHVLRGTASDPDGNLVQVRFLDSRPKGRRTWRPARGTTGWTAAVPLGPGTNTVRIQAFDDAGAGSRVEQVRILLRR